MKKLSLILTLLVLLIAQSAFADSKATALTAATAITSDDLIIIVDAPGGSAETKKITAANLFGTNTNIIQGALKINSDADGMSAAEMTTAGLYGTLFIATGAGTWILPDPAGGENLCLMSSGAAANLILDTTAGSTIRLKGTEQADGVGITQAAAKATGDFVCVVAVAAHKWSTMGVGGTWVSQ